MQGFDTIITRMMTLGLAMLIGFVCVKTKYITEEQKNSLSRVIVRITLPILVMTSLTSMDFDRQTLINSIHVLLISILVVVMLFCIGILTTKAARMGGKEAAMHRCMTCFGNVVFMAFPLLEALYGAEGLLYAAIYQLASDMCLWTFGMYQLTGENGEKKSFLDNIKRLLTPGTIAFVVAFIMMATGLKFTGVIGEVMTGIGSTTTYMSMLFIGGTLAQVDFKNIYKRVWLFVLTVLKMIAVPAILIFILKFLEINEVAKSVIIFQAAMPTSTVLVMLGMEYDCDIMYCTEGVFISHIAGLVTLPFVYYLMSVI